MSSSTTRPPASSSTTAQPAEKSFFDQQREVLLKEIGVVSSQGWAKRGGREGKGLTGGQSFEHVLANINKLNRSMEGVIAVSKQWREEEREERLMIDWLAGWQ
jgi:DASH complex subunit DAD1